jgi:NADH:ubiquinone oxidoreductase subunit 5 (subunit L)/multisubunit Na+/H+ antiporter MnhA subunit
MAWSCENPRRILPWVAEAVTGAILLAASLVGGRASLIIVAGSVGWALGVALLFMGYGLHRSQLWWSIPSLVGALAVFGAPLTLGFVTQASLVGELVSSGRPLWGVVLFAGQLFTIPALARLLLVPPPSPLPSRRLRLVVRGIGLGLPAVLLVMAGVYPPLLVAGLDIPSLRSLFAMPGLAGWLLWVVSSAVGCLLAWQEGNLRPRVESLLGLIHDLLRLEWLYGALAGAVERGLSVLRVADEMVGGAGALLWSWVLALILVLIWGS